MLDLIHERVMSWTEYIQSESKKNIKLKIIRGLNNRMKNNVSATEAI